MDAPTSPIRRFPFVVALIVSLAIAACTGPAGRVTIPPGATGSIAPPETGTPAADTPSPEPEFPLTVSDDEGTTVTIEEEPDSIVSLTPAATETLFALGVGDLIEGKAEDFFLYPPEAGAIPDVARFGEVDVERIVGSEPDVVIAGGFDFTPDDSVARLRELGVPVVVVYAPDIETVYSDIELLGTVVGRAEEAEALARRMRTEMTAVGAAVAGVEAPRVFYETGTDDSGAIYGVADRSFLAEMIELAGADTITTGSAESYAMPIERLIVEDPEIILLSDAAFGVTAEQVTARPGWNVITAVRSGDIRPIDDQTVTRPGPRLFLGLALLARTIHPDADIPEASPIPPVP